MDVSAAPKNVDVQRTNCAGSKVQDPPGSPLVLVADDDEHILELISFYLNRSGYRVELARTGTEALRKVTESHPELLILDITMPGPDGFQICRSLRRRSRVPIILLTARSSDVDKIAGLRFGADDYVTKPFNPDELMARVKAILRRSNEESTVKSANNVILGNLVVRIASREIQVAGESIAMTPKEFDLLATLAKFHGTALDRDQLLDLVWGTSFYAHRTVDVHVSRLRNKLSPHGIQIDTVWGVGYRLRVESG